MRVGRVLLLSLVAVNLTLVCQGHAADGGHTGVHLALLGEPHVGDEADASEEMAGVGEHGAREVSFAVREAGRSGDPAVLGGSHFSSLAALAVALLSSVGGGTRVLSVGVVTRIRWRSRAKRPPEPPPPQVVV
jgi:hypothetical protein